MPIDMPIDMQVTVVSRDPSVDADGCRVVTLFSKGVLRGGARSIDLASDGVLSRVLERGDFRAEPGNVLMLHDVAGANAARVLLAGAGDAAPDAREWRRTCDAIADALAASRAVSATVELPARLADEARPLDERAGALVRAVGGALHRSEGVARATPPEPPALVALTLVVPRAELDAVKRAAERARATSVGMSRARELGDLAPNACTPRHLANVADALADTHDALETRVLDEAEIRSLGMGALLSVAAGSREPPRLIAMEYRGAARTGAADDAVRPIVLIGKGITFDSGGISIKGGEGMDEMKYDMCGAAAVFGAIEACCLLALPIDVVGIVAAAENMPDGAATRPGDVVTTLDGKTVEILNTDAEGRLVLADALTWSARYRAAATIDVATLTGACVVALGHVASGLFCNDDALADALLEAGTRAGDPTWRLPTGPDWAAQLESNFADLANIGGRPAGAVTAACFLEAFAPDGPWAHLDIAGVAWRGGKRKGATGRPVALLTQYLFGVADAASETAGAAPERRRSEAAGGGEGGARRGKGKGKAGGSASR